MSKYGYYAVKVGRTPGVYYSKNDYMEQIEGFPHAEGRRFGTEIQAWEYIYSGENNAEEDKGEEVKADKPTPQQAAPQPEQKQPQKQNPPKNKGKDKQSGGKGNDRWGKHSRDWGRNHYGAYDDDCFCEENSCDMGRALVISEMRSIKTALNKQMTILQENMKIISARVEEALQQDDATLRAALKRMADKKVRKRIQKEAEREARLEAEREEQDRLEAEKIARQKEEKERREREKEERETREQEKLDELRRKAEEDEQAKTNEEEKQSEQEEGEQVGNTAGSEVENTVGMQESGESSPKRQKTE